MPYPSKVVGLSDTPLHCTLLANPAERALSIVPALVKNPESFVNSEVFVGISALSYSSAAALAVASS